MTTIKLAVLKHTKAKDGSYKIRISIGHKSETHYIVTKYRVSSFSHFVNGQVVGQPDASHINMKLRQLLTDYDERLERINNPGDFTCEQLRDLLKNMTTRPSGITFGTVAQQYIAQLRAEGRNATAKIIDYQTKRFLKFCNGDIMLTAINTMLIEQYTHHIKASGVSPAYQTISIVPIRTIINHAIKMQQVRYDVHPFLYWQRPPSEPRNVDMSLDDTRKIFQFETPYKGMRRAADLFKLSYMLGGMNLMDMLKYDFRDYDKKPLSYIRAKTQNKKATNRTTSFTIVPEAYPIIERYMNKKTGRLDLNTDATYHSIIAMTDESLKRLSKRLNLEIGKNICIYSARKSFVQHGFDLGISLETLEYCIGQSVKASRPIFNYLKIMRKHADVAIRKIIDNLNDPVTTQPTEQNAAMEETDKNK